VNSLEAVLADAQRLGMLGDRPIAEVIEHARAFVRALPLAVQSVIDLGSGGGVPGLVVAVERPESLVTLVDRRQRRTDFLERAVRRLGLGERCQVWCCDVEEVVRRLDRSESGLSRWDAVISRGFGPPRLTASLARRLVRPSGVIVISEPPSERTDRWPPELLSQLGLERVTGGPGSVVVLTPSPRLSR